MKSILFLAVFSAAISQALCQILPSAASQSTIKEINLPVNAFNGTASVSVPLYHAPLLKGGGIPVGISYTTSGIKVNEKSGPVGLGWNLVAGGKITRIVLGHPDEESPVNTNKTFSNLSDALFNHQDTEKDIFYFEYPGGGGRFILGHGFNTQNLPKDYDNIFSLPDSELKIEFHIENPLDSYFTITDPYGNRYIFGDTPDAREVTKVERSQVNETAYDPSLTEEYISTWHLTTIDHAGITDSENTTFNYGTEGQSTVVEEGSETQFIALGNYMEGISPLYDQWERLPGGNLWEGEWVTEIRYDATATRTETAVKRLTEIVTTKANIQFNYEDRNDMPGAMKLTSLQLKDSSGGIVSNTTFDYQTNYATSSYHFDLNYPQIPPAKDMQRLMLKSVKKDGLTIRKFNYKHEESEADNNWFQLPPRGSYYTDHWGYNNSGPHHRAYVPFPSAIEEDINEQGQTATFALAGMDKSSWASAKANILTEVHFPSGGYTRFRYQNHPNGGGVRVYRIESFNEYDVRISGTEYEYYDGDLTNFVAGPPPAYVRYVERISDSEDRFVVFPQAESLVYDLNGSPHGYRKVKQTNLLNGSSVVHHYKADYGETDINPLKNRFKLETLTENLVDEAISSTPYQSPYSSYDLKVYDRGSEVKTEVFDESGMLISETVYDYEHAPTTALFSGLAVDKLRTDRDELFSFLTQDVHIVFTSEYEIEVKAPRLKTRTTTTYDAGGEVTNIASFDYDSFHKTLPIQVTTESSTGHFSQKNIDYPFSNLSEVADRFEDPGVLTNMKNNNQVAIPIQEKSLIKYPHYTGYKVSGARLTTFKSFGDQILPHRSYSLMMNEPGTFDPSNYLLVSTNDYNANGQLISQIGRSGIEQRYSYHADGTVATSTLANGNGESLSTSYSYESLVGVRSVTGPDDRSVSYEYDDLNRLQTVKDNDGSIVKRYRYNYGSDADDFQSEMSANLSISHPRLIDTSIAFSATDVQMYGEGTYSWRVDGVSKGEGKTAFHSFNTEGSYSYTFTMENPEYANNKVYDGSVMIYEDYWSLNPINGPSSACAYPNNAIDYSHEMDIDDLVYSITHKTGAFNCEDALPLEYTWTYDVGNGPVSMGTGSQAILAKDNNEIRGSTGTVIIEVTATDNCGMTKTITKSVQIQTWDSSCGGEDTGGGGDGGDNGDGSPTNPWSVQITGGNAQQSICPTGEPSSFTFGSQINEGDHSCTNSSYSYTWEYVVNSQTYPLGSGTSKTVTRSALLQNGSTSDSYTIKLTVTDECGESMTHNVPLTFKLNC